MKEKLLIIILVIVIIITIIFGVFITSTSDETTLNEISNISGIDISIRENTLSSTGATVVIKDTVNTNIVYSGWYRIDTLSNNKWQKLDGEVSSNMESKGYTLNENGEVVFDIYWGSDYGELDPGTYRLVKKINNDYIAVEFTIK